MNEKGTRFRVWVAASIAVVAAVALTAGLSWASDRTPERAAIISATTPATTVPPALAQAAAVFAGKPEPAPGRTGPTAGGSDAPNIESLTPAARRLVSQLKDPPGGINRALQQVVETDNGPVTLVPGTDLVCIEVPDGDVGPAGGCAPISAAVDGELSIGLRATEDGPGLVVGLAPDGITTVRDPTSGRSTTVTDNVWRLEDTRASQVQLITQNGTTSRTVHVR